MEPPLSWLFISALTVSAKARIFMSNQFSAILTVQTL
jgi:hypothetical protein